jgi:hypothetical protein
MPRARIVLSFDHELPLGGLKVTYAESLFDPTDQLLRLASDLGVSVCLFTDILCAARFKEWDEPGFFLPYCAQLERAVQSGHEVQLHLHPHWVDTQFAEGTFRPSPHFTLGHFADRPAPDDIPGIVSRGVGLLSEICTRADRQYRCVAYRAGGYVLAPHTATILRALHDNGIRIDSSIAKGFYLKTPHFAVDYRHMPRAGNWFIAPTGPLNEPAAAGIYEIPIGAKPKNPVTNLPTRLRRRLHKRRERALGGTGFLAGQKSALIDRVRHACSPRMLTFDMHALTVNDLLSVVRHHLRRHRNDEHLVLSAIGHPKSMGPYSFALLASFVQQVRKDFGGEVEFGTYRQVHDEVRPDA